jgi:SH3 domain protein
MNKCCRLAGSALIALTIWTTTAWAETRYVSDQLVVSLREQPQQNAASITHLKTDTPVTVLEETGDFVKVKTEEGEIGYIQRHYLIPETPKSVIINRLQQERDRLADKVAELQKQLTLITSRSEASQQELTEQLAESNRQLGALQKDLEECQAALIRTRQEFQALQSDASEVVAIAKERDQLRKTNQELATAVTELEEKVKDLTISALIKWFLAGAGVLLLGWIFGRFAGGRRRSRL